MSNLRLKMFFFTFIFGYKLKLQYESLSYLQFPD